MVAVVVVVVVVVAVAVVVFIPDLANCLVLIAMKVPSQGFTTTYERRVTSVYIVQ